MTSEKKEFFEQLWSNCHSTVEILCKNKLHSKPWLIDDCIHDVYLALAEAISTNVTVKNWPGWLYKTAQYTAISYYRKENHLSYVNIDSNTDSEMIQLSYEQDFIDLMITEKMIAEARQEILSTLNESEYQLYHDYYEDHKILKEIASSQKVKESTIRQRHFRLKKKIMDLIKKKCETIP